MAVCWPAVQAEANPVPRPRLIVGATLGNLTVNDGNNGATLGGSLGVQFGILGASLELSRTSYGEGERVDRHLSGSLVLELISIKPVAAFGLIGLGVNRPAVDGPIIGDQIFGQLGAGIAWNFRGAFHVTVEGLAGRHRMARRSDDETLPAELTIPDSESFTHLRIGLRATF